MEWCPVSKGAATYVPFLYDAGRGQAGGVARHLKRMAHDLRSHWLTRAWDGHLQYGRRPWQLVKGRRPYLLNREPVSRHLRLLERHGFRVVSVLRDTRAPELPRSALASEFRQWSDDLRSTAGAVLQSLRRRAGEATPP